MNNRRLPLLMTASVSTRGMKGACFSDEQREQMYLETLRYYLETLPEDQPIVFADNSGWGLDRFQRLADQFEKKERGVRGQELGGEVRVSSSSGEELGVRGKELGVSERS